MTNEIINNDNKQNDIVYILCEKAPRSYTNDVSIINFPRFNYVLTDLILPDLGNIIKGVPTPLISFIYYVIDPNYHFSEIHINWMDKLDNFYARYSLFKWNKVNWLESYDNPILERNAIHVINKLDSFRYYDIFSSVTKLPLLSYQTVEYLREIWMQVPVKFTDRYYIYFGQKDLFINHCKGLVYERYPDDNDMWYYYELLNKDFYSSIKWRLLVEYLKFLNKEIIMPNDFENINFSNIINWMSYYIQIFIQQILIWVPYIYNQYIDYFSFFITYIWNGLGNIIAFFFHLLPRNDILWTIESWFRHHDRPFYDYFQFCYRALSEELNQNRGGWWYAAFLIGVLVFVALHLALVRGIFLLISKIIKGIFFFWLETLPGILSGKIKLRTFFITLVVAPIRNRLIEHFIIKYTWVKYNITYERLIRYPVVFIKQYFILSIWDLFISAKNSYILTVFTKISTSDLRLEYNTWKVLRPGFLYWNGQEIPWTDATILINSGKSFYFLISLLLLYHVYFWVSLFWKKLYFLVDKYEYLVNTTIIFLIVTNKAFITIFWVTIVSIEVSWFNVYMFMFWALFAHAVSVFIDEESDDIYDVLHEPTIWSYTLWTNFKLIPEVDRYFDNWPVDFNWETREEIYYSELTNINYKGQVVWYMQYVKKMREQQVNKKSFHQYNLQDWKWMLERKSRNSALFDLENNITVTSSWEKLMLVNNPFGNYDLNKFTLMGILPKINKFVFTKILPSDWNNWGIFKILFPKYLHLPWTNGIWLRISILGKKFLIFRIQFTPDFIDFQLTPIYMFLKNPKFFVLYYEAPYALKNWDDLNDKGESIGIEPKSTFDEENTYVYYQLLDFNWYLYLHKLYDQSFSRFHNHRFQMVLGDYFYGNRKTFLDGYTYIWDNTLFTRPKPQFFRFKSQLYCEWGLNFRDRDIKRRQYVSIIWSFLRRYRLIEHIFFRNWIKKNEFMLQIAAEDLMRNDSLTNKGVDRRKLKTENRKRAH